MNLSRIKPEDLLFIDEQAVTNTEVVDLLRRQGAIPRMVREWILDRTLRETPLEATFQQKLLTEYRNTQKLIDNESYAAHLQQRHIDENILLKMLSRPHQVVRYREERWGPFAQSLYLQHKERFDMVTYNRLEAADFDIMQEVYFRLKDREESWDALARQFPAAGPKATAQRNMVPVANVEAPVLKTLRQCQPGRVARPLQVGKTVVVVSLVEFQPSSFNEEVRIMLLRQAFDEWLEQECSRMLQKITFPE